MISDALESPVGQCTSYGVFCIGAVIATILAATNHPQAAVKVAAVPLMCLCVAVTLIIWKCGTLLVGTINRSLQNSAAGSSKPAGPILVAPGAEQRKDGDQDNASAVARKRVGGHPHLLAARKKIKMAMSFCLSMAVHVMFLLMFAVGSEYGIAAPLLFFGIPMGLAPPFWFIFNVQLHAGRSKPPVSRRVGSLVTSAELPNKTSRIETSRIETSRIGRTIIPNRDQLKKMSEISETNRSMQPSYISDVSETIVSLLDNVTSRSSRSILPTETTASPR